ncbi:MAG: NAD(P)H-binding protein [Chloroflexota bacterium]
MILVTGSTGFVGRVLMRQLQEANIEARGFNGHINNVLNIRKQLEDIKIVIHLSGAETRGRNRLLDSIDVEGTQRLVDECQRAGIQHLIYVSRIGADPSVWQPLLRAKGLAERAIQRSRVPYTILQSTSVYGWGDRYFELIVGLAIWSWPFVWLPGGGRNPVQPLWVEDLARCIMITLKDIHKKNKTLMLAGSERMSYYVLVELLLGMSGHRRMPVQFPLQILKPLTVLMFRWWYWPAVSRYFADRFFVPEVTEVDIVQRNFGFQPVRVRESISYLNRSGLRWRLFRR